MIFFSVIIPLFNKEKYIKTTLESVLQQTFQDFEIIVINDGSTDNSESEVLKFDTSKIKYFKTENKGVSAARNFGITQAKGNYIAFLDADDYWYPYFLDEIHTYIHRFPEQKVFSLALEIEFKNNTFPSVYSITKSGDFEIVNYFDASMKQSVISISASVFEKSVFEKSGVFNQKYQAGEDTDLWVRIGLLFSVVFIWKIGARYVYDNQSLSRTRNITTNKAEFKEYKSLEKENLPLKRFLDYNRFSLAIESKLNNEQEKFRAFYNDIEQKSLSYKKRVLLHLPAWTLSFLVRIKNNLAYLGFGNSVFK